MHWCEVLTLMDKDRLFVTSLCGRLNKINNVLTAEDELSKNLDRMSPPLLMALHKVVPGEGGFDNDEQMMQVGGCCRMS